jgi:hypothetical protein
LESVEKSIPSIPGDTELNFIPFGLLRLERHDFFRNVTELLAMIFFSSFDPDTDARVANIF